MTRKLLILLALVLAAGVTWLGHDQYAYPELLKLSHTFAAIAALYFVFSIILEEAVAGRIHESKTRYGFRKTVSVLLLGVALIVLLRIWIPNPEALLVAYGLMGAGVAISLQDLFKNFAGGIVIFLTGLYQVGNRIEMKGSYGDVIDIGLFHTTLLEIREWVAGDQATGRITVLPNGQVLSNEVNNYTKDHHFLWDELSVVVTPQSDWHEAMSIMRERSQSLTVEFADEARRSLSQLEQRYYLEDRTMEPSVYLAPAKDGYRIAVRYVVEVRERRRIQSELLQQFITAFDEHERIELAPTTIAIMDTREGAADA